VVKDGAVIESQICVSIVERLGSHIVDLSRCIDRFSWKEPSDIWSNNEANLWHPDYVFARPSVTYRLHHVFVGSHEL